MTDTTISAGLGVAEPAISTAPGSTIVLDRTTSAQLQEPGDHDKFAHIVPKHKLTEALVMGTPVQALCGKVWVPSTSPERFPVCPDCKQAWESVPPGDNDPEI